ncbi:hypothetical protein [Streptomyces sp. 840.1]|uniref:hypothetical protein n=1 Tax=Streptomyces sp. 840.1 TaxID=2485152 RepID=UPI001C85DE80|nr:hypothetical protein [Streptomyces sp. 840.1]
MITNILAPVLLAAAAALVVTPSAEAADGGTLNFTGALANASCDVASGGGSADNIPVDLGRVSFADIGSRTEARLGAGKNIDLVVTCPEPARF